MDSSNTCAICNIEMINQTDIEYIDHGPQGSPCNNVIVHIQCLCEKKEFQCKHCGDFLECINTSKDENQLENEPDEVSTPESVPDCCICGDNHVETDSNPIFPTSCNHHYHYNCLVGWFKANKNRQCPYCSKTYDPIVPFKDSEENINGFNNDIINNFDNAHTLHFIQQLAYQETQGNPNVNNYCIWKYGIKFKDISEIDYTNHFSGCFMQGIPELNHMCIKHYKKYTKDRFKILINKKTYSYYKMTNYLKCSYGNCQYTAKKEFEGKLYCCTHMKLFFRHKARNDIIQWHDEQIARRVQYEDKLYQEKHQVCNGYFKNGVQCGFHALKKYNGYCAVHKKQAENPVMPTPPISGEDIQVPQSVPGSIVCTNNGPSLSSATTKKKSKCNYVTANGYQCNNQHLTGKTKCILHLIL